MSPSPEEGLLIGLLLLHLDTFNFFYTTALMLLDSSLWFCQNINFNECFVDLVKMKILLGKNCHFSQCNYFVMSM